MIVSDSPTYHSFTNRRTRFTFYSGKWPMPRSSNRILIAIAVAIGMSGTIIWPATAAAGADELFLRVLAAPDDPVLNLQFAAAAEARGDIRHALAALERARNAKPDDRAIAAEYERVRNKLLPTVTAVVAQVGMSVASNGRQLPSTSSRRHLDGIVDSAVVVEDERTTHDVRLRSRITLQGQQHWENTELTSGRIAVESGPVFYVNRDLWMQVAPGTAMVWLHEKRLFNEASVAVSLGGVLGGLSQIATARYGWRRGNEDIQNADSHVFDLEGRFSANLSLIAGDILYLQPRWRLNQAIDPLPQVAIGQTVLGDFTAVARDISPWSYQEYGARVTYFAPALDGRVLVGAGVSLVQRDYSNGYVLDPAGLTAGVHMLTSQKRHDLYLEPTAHVVFPRLLGPKYDFRIDYRLEDNHSNDTSREFQNHIIGARVTGRY